METQRVSGAKKRVLSLVVLGCLWAFVVPADARAQQFDKPSCIVQSVTRKGVTTWQIKGTVDVSGLIANPNNTTVEVKAKILFQKKAKDAADWADMFDTTITTTASNGTAKIDTGNKNFTPPPAKGEEYRISVSGTWMKVDPPSKNGDLPAVESPSVTPVP